MTEDLRGKVTLVIHELISCKQEGNVDRDVLGYRIFNLELWEEELAQVEDSCEDDTELDCLKEQVDEEVYVARRLLAWLRRRDAGLDSISTIAYNTHCLQPLLPPV